MTPPGVATSFRDDQLASELGVSAEVFLLLAAALGQPPSLTRRAASMRRNRSFEADIGRAVSAAVAAEKFEDIDSALSEAVTQLDSLAVSTVEPTKLKFDALIGMGGYGSVFLVSDASNSRQFALKMLRKGLLAGKSDLPKRALREKEALETLRHPFISKLHMTFQDEDSLYYLLDLATGGDLYALLDIHPVFPEAWALFYTASLALALRHMHKHCYVYRDMKPENVLLDSGGYVCLADMGFAKKVEDRTFTACGTDEYVPPELLEGKGRTAAADWWGLGVLLHEMITGRTPFEGNTTEIFAQITKYHKGGDDTNEKLRLSLSAVSEECGDLVSGLLIGDESGRLGSGPEGFLGIQMHAWFKSLKWGALLHREMAAPYIPPPFDASKMEVPADEQVMRKRNFDKAKIEPLFASFGPTVSMPQAK